MTVGEELLLGETVDTNSAWLARELHGLGMSVEATVTVGDREADIREAVSRALERADAVLVTGGLGPTPDDLTRNAVADLLNRDLRVDPSLRDALEARFRARGYDRMPETNLQQVQVPSGALVLANPIGTASGLVLEEDGKCVILFPGVPAELKRIFAESAAGYLQESFPGRLWPTRYRDVYTTGIPESELALLLGPHLEAGLGGVDVAFLPGVAGVALRLTVRDAADGERAAVLLDRAEGLLEPVLAAYRYRARSGDLVEAVADALRQAGKRLATAESCTGGGVAKRLTDRPGSSDYFVGGAVSYSNEAKATLLGVDPGVIEREGAVSESVAEAMALGVAERLGAEAGLGITGVAGPDGGTEAKPVGTVWYAVSLDGRVVARTERFPGDRAVVRARAGQAALALLLRMLEGAA